MPRSKSFNLRQKYVEGIKKVIRSKKVNIMEVPDYCSVNDPYCSTDFAAGVIESLKKTGELKKLMEGD